MGLRAFGVFRRRRLARQKDVAVVALPRMLGEIASQILHRRARFLAEACGDDDLPNVGPARKLSRDLIANQSAPAEDHRLLITLTHHPAPSSPREERHIAGSRGRDKPPALYRRGARPGASPLSANVPADTLARFSLYLPRDGVFVHACPQRRQQAPVEPRLPGDKSITHRAYLLGALAEDAVVDRPNEGDDCRAALVRSSRSACAWSGAKRAFAWSGARAACGTGGAPQSGDCGTGLRLLLGVLAGQRFTTLLTGDASLQRRPVERVLAPLRGVGGARRGPRRPSACDAHRRRSHRHRASPHTSAQVKSGTPLAGIQASGRTRLEGIAGSRDRPERLLPAFGCPVVSAPDAVEVEGPGKLRAADVRIPADPSAATFYLVAAALLPGSEVTLEGVSLNPTRISHFDIFRRMGLTLDVTPESEPGPEPFGRVAARGGELRAVEIGPLETGGLIDELPAIAVLAAFARGTTRVTGAAELRVKGHRIA